MKELLRLRQALQEDPRILLLSTLEKQMEEDETVKRLSQNMKEKAEAYEEALRHGEKSDWAKSTQHELYLAKKALDENELVRKYNHAYGEVRRLYDEIDGILYGDYRTPLPCGGIHA